MQKKFIIMTAYMIFGQVWLTSRRKQLFLLNLPEIGQNQQEQRKPTEASCFTETGKWWLNHKTKLSCFCGTGSNHNFLGTLEVLGSLVWGVLLKAYGTVVTYNYLINFFLSLILICSFSGTRGHFGLKRVHHLAVR